jgi:hypothetical protein
VQRLRLAALILGGAMLMSSAGAGSAPPALKVTMFDLRGGNAGGITELVAGPGGIWFSSLGPTQVGRMTTAGKAKRWKVPTLVAADYSAAGNNIVLGPDGNIWITGQTANASVVAKVRPNGKGTVVDLGMPSAPGRDAIAALGTRKGGPLYYGIWWNSLGRVTTGGNVLPKITQGVPVPLAAVGWAADRSGAMWFVYNRWYGRVTGTSVQTWEPAGSHKFVDVTMGADGKMYLADRNAPAGLGIARVDASGAYKQFKVKGGVRAITTGPDGNVWGVGDFEAVLVRVTPRGALKTYTIPGHTGHIASGFGKLWIESGGGFIGRVDLPKK